MSGFLFILGLIVGSFLNVLIYRIPRGEGFVAGRSRCPHCHHDLVWRDLVPLVSYLILRGKCRYCRKPISAQYPLIELISGIFFVMAPSLFALALLEIFLVLAVIDYQHLIIPDSLLIVLAAIALVQSGLHHWASALGCAAFFFLLWVISRGRWIGFGDVKLAGVLGLLFGFPGAVIVIYLAVIGGGLLSVILLVLKKATMKTALPLGTLMTLCAGFYLFFQAPVMRVLASWNLLW